MNKTRLLSCPSCARHVRIDEHACPFCAATLPASFADTPAPRRPPARLNRAALFAFGATSIGLAAACGGGGSGNPGSDASPDVESDSRAQPAYGCFPPECHGLEAGTDMGQPEASAEGGEAESGSGDGATDGGADDADAGAIAAYGAFPADASKG